MRLSFLAVVFLFSSCITFAQHTASAPSPPPPSPPPMAAPSPPAPAPSPAPSFSPPAHSEAVSVPAPSIPANHFEPAPSANHAVDHTNDRANETIPTRTSDREPVEKPKKEEPDSHLRTCDGAPCKTEAGPEHSEPDHKREPCHHGKCSCPPGQSASKGGCVTTVSTNQETCGGGAVWNGSACVPQIHCPAEQIWNGSACAPRPCAPGQIRNGTICENDCAGVTARAQSMIAEVRRARRERDEACGQDPSSDLCKQLDGHYQTVLAEYRNLEASAPGECRSSLPDPDSL